METIVAHIDQSQSESKWGVRLSFLAMLCSFPVVVAIAIAFLANATGLNDDVNFAFIQGTIVLLGTVVATLVCIPALILGIAGLCMERRAFTWVAFLFSLVPAGLMAVEVYSIYRYEATKEKVAANTHHIIYSYEVLKRNADGSIERMSGGGGGSEIRPDKDDRKLATDGRVHWIAQSCDDGRVTFHIQWPDGSTSETQFVLGEQQESWDPSNQHGLRLTIDELDNRQATTERLLMQAKEDHRDPVYALVDALSSQDTDLAEDAAKQLGKMGQGETAVPVLVDRLNDERYLVRNAAARQIREIGPQAKAAVPTLIDLLSDENAWVRSSVVTALASIGSEAKAAGPALRKLRDAQPANARQTFDWALGRVGTVSEAEIPKLIEALRADEARLREAHKSRIASRESGLVEALEDSADEIRLRALDEAIRLGPKSDETLAALIELLKDKSPDVRLKAALAVGQYGESAVAGAPFLIEILRDDDSRLREMAARSLGLIGPVAGASAPALQAASEDKSAAVRVAAALALWQVDHHLPSAIDALVQLLGENQDRSVRFSATQALKNIGADAVPPLIEALRNPVTQMGSQEALAVMGPPAIPFLIEGLSDRGGRVGFSSGAALVKIGTPAVQPLTEALNHASPEVRASAAMTLSYYQSIPYETVTALGDALKDPNARVRDVANRALRQRGERGDQKADRVRRSVLETIDASDSEAKDR